MVAPHLTGNGMTECADQSELQGEVRGVGLRLRLRRERRRERPVGLSARIARQGGTAALIAATAAPPDAIMNHHHCAANVSVFIHVFMYAFSFGGKYSIIHCIQCLPSCIPHLGSWPRAVPRVCECMYCNTCSKKTSAAYTAGPGKAAHCAGVYCTFSLAAAPQLSSTLSAHTHSLTRGLSMRRACSSATRVCAATRMAATRMSTSSAVSAASGDGLPTAAELADWRRGLDGEQSWIPVSYTHLTLPTICSV